MQLVTILWDHTTAHAVVSMKEMEKIAKKSLVSHCFFVKNILKQRTFREI